MFEKILKRFFPENYVSWNVVSYALLEIADLLESGESLRIARINAEIRAERRFGLTPAAMDNLSQKIIRLALEHLTTAEEYKPVAVIGAPLFFTLLAVIAEDRVD